MECMGQDVQNPVSPSGLTYKASGKHCEPITAQKPGTKCPAWSAPLAQRLLDMSEPMGDKRVATCRGLAFVAQLTHPDGDVWHGYPESWDKIPSEIKKRWKDAGWISGRDLKRWKTRQDVASAWREFRDEDQ